MWRLVVALGFTLMASACGGDDGSTDDAGATGGAGPGAETTGGFANSASLRGAVSLNVLAPPTCSLPAQYFDLPEIGGGHPVTSTTKGQTLEHGGMTAKGELVSIECVWQELTDGVYLDATIELPIGDSPTSIGFGSRRLAVGEAAEGGFLASSPTLGYYGARTNSCTLTAIDIDHASRSIWGEIRCPTLGSLEDDSVCELAPSYFFFENCPEL